MAQDIAGMRWLHTAAAYRYWRGSRKTGGCSGEYKQR
ncbi:hypothetical protein AG1IA_06013 [Rhizoctonia solani AG-1 IA]|uniref:Uncharacterized protein n=1 Tax=Thanatephorus cucumeris (strain AG1-IA) TaxID=983506 RepID=L8WPN3_THACA|nr:hypothetical protein AG1IA_06013 [Rhizoctonia solani AG-1 IA]